MQLERAAEDVDLAESAINVLAICKGMCDDFCRLGFTSVDTRLMCTIKLTDVIHILFDIAFPYGGIF